MQKIEYFGTFSKGTNTTYIICCYINHFLSYTQTVAQLNTQSLQKKLLLKYSKQGSLLGIPWLGEIRILPPYCLLSARSKI